MDRVNFLLNGLETVRQEEVLASMRLFAREVMPHLDPAARSQATPAAVVS